MPGAAAIINPNAPASKRIHLFYNTNTKNLGIQLRDESKTVDETETFVPSDTDQPGLIVNPSQITSTDLTGVNIVVGFTAKPKETTVSHENCGCDPTQNDVSIISPVYKPISATEVSNLTIASTSSDSTAYIFYLTGTDFNTTTINEITLGEDSPGSYENTVRILPGSSLAAYYVAEQDNRYILYQAHKPVRLHEYSPNTESVSDTELVNSGDAKPNTPLAATIVDGKVYLYYIDGSNQLRVITKTGGSWGSSSPVASAHASVDDASQIAIVPAANGNHIFYTAQGDTKYKFQHIVDKRT